MIHLNDEQMIPLQDSELDAVSGGTAVEYAVMLALIIYVCVDTARPWPRDRFRTLTALRFFQYH